ncbi:hypothetical protein [Marinobacterium iners]|uniref:Uncharacterized protein n=1 Tax=Marinobacterium iners DSM 11526 TaxID=1122198 RepID=A0A1H3XAI2_9GAMM|nr:hypothetical protein [Marinobacterium iners]SDZ95632.1 hypothetical protein SAMN02745729_10173 [Marinobacterium iners DSM 11526]
MSQSNTIPVSHRTTVGELKQLLGENRSITAIRKRGAMTRLIVRDKAPVIRRH